MTDATFLWHDYETFGADPRRDRPCQFAALRTDDALRPIEDPVVWYCRPTSDVLPVPEACLITGITPQLADERGLPEYDFAARIFESMSVPGTCAVGYNNFRFDDEVTRFLFWRNFIDPYAREFRNGNSRFDLIDVLRMTCALRPNGIEWHYDAEGSPVFRLEDLARANGLPTDHAHDALADVNNTLGMARRVLQHSPKLWRWALSLRERHRVEALLHPQRVLLHVSSRFPAAMHCIAPVLPLFSHPVIRSQWLVWNLREDPAEFAAFDADTLSDLFWTPAADLPDGMKRLPVKWVRTNRCPMLAPPGVLSADAAERTGIDLQAAEARASKLRRSSALLDALRQVFDQPRESTPADAETALYDGFVSDPDRRVAERVRRETPSDAAARLDSGDAGFDDERLVELLLHYVGRHAPDRLSEAHRIEWKSYRRRKLVDDPDLASIRVDEYRARIAELRGTRPERNGLLDQLENWLETLSTGA